MGKRYFIKIILFILDDIIFYIINYSTKDKSSIKISFTLYIEKQIHVCTYTYWVKSSQRLNVNQCWKKIIENNKYLLRKLRQTLHTKITFRTLRNRYRLNLALNLFTQLVQSILGDPIEIIGTLTVPINRHVDAKTKTISRK